MLKTNVEQLLNGYQDNIILYFNEDNIIETNNGAALTFIIEVTNPSDLDLITDISDLLEANCNIIDWIDLPIGAKIIMEA